MSAVGDATEVGYGRRYTAIDHSGMGPLWRHVESLFPSDTLQPLDT
jgi:hypothetical protein